MRGYRVAVLGPITPLGRRVREALTEREFPATELKLFESGEVGEARLTEFEGEIVVTQPIDPELFPRLDVIFFAGGAERTHVQAAVEQGVLTILLSPSPELQVPVSAPGVNDRSLPAGTRLVQVPQPSALLIGTVLAALRRAFIVRQAVATVLVPAMELGKEGAEELQQQTINVLSFRPVPKKVLQDQLAFNVNLPPEDLVASVPSAEERLEREVSELAGLQAPVAIFLARAAVFHGYALVLWVSLEGDPTIEQVTQSLRAGALAVHRLDRSKPTPSPVSAAQLDRIQVGRLRRDGSTPGGFWIWAVSDLTTVDPATNAVRLAEKLLEVPARRK